MTQDYDKPDLSPAAQAVFKAAWTCPIVLGDHPTTRSRQIAAALRAAADQWKTEIQGQPTSGFIGGIRNCIDALSEIAAELEAQ